MLMYHWIEDKEFLSKMRSACSDIVNKVVLSINKDEKMNVHMQLVGSGAKHLETQNENEAVDLDYNINIIEIYDSKYADGKLLKEYIQKKFNEVLKSKGLNDCDDSKSALTTKKMQFNSGNKTSFSIDLTITKLVSEKCNKLIHVKTGDFRTDKWEWNIIRDSSKIDYKAKCIKDNGLWNKLRQTYLNKKNYYLSNNDNEHPSYNCYIESINEVYSNIK